MDKKLDEIFVYENRYTCSSFSFPAIFIEDKNIMYVNDKYPMVKGDYFYQYTKELGRDTSFYRYRIWRVTPNKGYNKLNLYFDGRE